MSSKTTYENQYLVFDARDGPKVIIEQLNAFGQEGWQLQTMLNVGETQIVAFLTKGNVKDAPNPKQSEAQKIASLWTSGNKDEKDEE
tara:strand:+ start:248 stop:508 length:261 start_codon:yes stop_codon:yes gene_type:complete